MSTFLVTSTPGDLGDDPVNLVCASIDLAEGECLRRIRMGDRDVKVWALYRTAEIGVVLNDAEIQQ